jgi:xanthine dehydrogenase accessory factor
MSDLEIYQKAAQLLSTDDNVVLITVISASGSTPGKVGYKMLVFGKNAEILGTVGGGLSEVDMINMARNMLPTKQSQVVRFDLDGSGGDERGICGGSIEFLLETFDRNSLPLFTELSSVVEKGGEGVLLSVISPTQPSEKVFVRNADQISASTSVDFSSETIESIKELAAKELPAKKMLDGGVEIFVEPVLKQPMVFIFGAGHLGSHISQYAKSMDFGVTVCDDRMKFANRQRFPDVDAVVVESFDTVFERLEIDRNSYIVIVTKGHKSDEIVLEEAVKTDAKYIGMIGSRKKTSTILKRLQERGVPEGILRRVCSPIGISIGAVTPEEIALSIVCELVKIRRLGDTTPANHMKMDFPKRLRS